MTDSNGNNRQSDNEAEVRCGLGCSLFLLITMGVSVFYFIYSLIAEDKFTVRMDRLKYNYGHADNVTMSDSLTCKPSIPHFYDAYDCQNYDPCKRYCTGWFDARDKKENAETVLFFMAAVFVVCLFTLFCSKLGFNTIEDLRAFISKCRSTRIIQATESINEYTSIATDPRFCKDMGGFNKAHKNQSDFVDDAADSFNDYEAAMELSNMEFT